ncbi:gfo/Idh/MocA family oxidoreductase [Rhodococcus sp. 06-156-3C]|uniref:Gfo/Idh/MocA family protein n=1 Tax=Nocardiaceae TaxID=85025 RepID=UPI000522FA50|nr:MULTISPECIES: Gfo/Idh/MocA family oxidoreductase [Rhodococcus]OZD19473.1 gfo/Idh/MocA family oxidoreductase [Rhodococcus sp. 06-156-3C]OZD21805.1 gfo/Idh/MocA family oxidoreductase [Rhodococcus sp. 06-156-4C]OZD25492.1 gfo/Idh/MocA family oxidoreductase [Rhodococcus sp. 06-156-4a]OZD32895.1 gfo/Idh/MocA family oxidoreductase [Rhodococcus sp. 06-156-3b]OZD42032.1 gfo/Idh/MocA family oxidoreductase [Rhodococcus sp. 06-156-3]
MNQLRIGVLGASRIAEEAIVEPATALGHRLVACAARDKARAEAFGDKYGFERVLESYQDVVDDPDVDVVYNPLANSLHAPWNLAAIRAGKSVLTEKPFSRDREEAVRVSAAADAANIVVMEGFHYLFHPVTQRIFQLVADGTLGELRHVEVEMRMPAPEPDDLRWPLDLAGGVMMDLGCYGLHVLRHLGAYAGGEPTVREARAVERHPGVDESFDANVEFPSGATGATLNSMTDPDYLFTLRVTGSRGEAFAHNYIKPSTDDRVSITVGNTTSTEHLGTRSSYLYQLEAFARHLQHGTELPMGPGDAVANMAMVDDAYRAAGMSPR